MNLHSSLVTLLLFVFVVGCCFHDSFTAVVAQTFDYIGYASGAATVPTPQRGFIGITNDLSGNLYVSSYSNPATLAKFTTSPFTLSMNVDTTTSVCNSLIYGSSYLYVACSPLGSSVILRRNAADLSAAGSIARTERLVNNIFIFDDFVYVVSADSPSVLIRIHISNFTVESALELTGIDAVQGAVLTSNGSHIFGATDDAPISIIKMERLVWDRFYITQGYLNTGEDGMNHGLAEDGTFLYAATTQAAPGFVVKVRMDTLERVSAVTLSSGPVAEDELHDICIDRFTGYAYITVYFTDHAHIVRISTLDNMARIDAVDPTDSNSNPERIIMVNQRLYVTATGAFGDPDVVLMLSSVTTSTSTTTSTTSTTTTTTTTTPPVPTTPAPPTTTTTTSTTTTPAPPSTSTSTTTVTTTTSTTLTSTTTSTTTTPAPPFGYDDDSLALAGSSTVAIAAGISAGAGALFLCILLFVISRKPDSKNKALPGNSSTNGDNMNNNNNNNSNDTNSNTTAKNSSFDQNQGIHVEVGQDDVFQDDEVHNRLILHHDDNNNNFNGVEMQPQLSSSPRHNGRNDDDDDDGEGSMLHEFRKSITDNDDPMKNMPPLDSDARNADSVPKWRNSGLRESGMM